MTARQIAQQDVLPVAEFQNYIANNWYVGVGPQAFANGAALPGNSARFYLAVIKETMTISALGLRVSTLAAGGNAQAAIYANDPTHMRPTGAALISTANMSTASATSINATASIQLQPGFYWFGINTDNATAAFVTPSAVSPFMSQVAGSATQANCLTSNGGSLSFVSTPLTFGTWGDLTAVTWTEGIGSTLGGAVQFKVASVP